MTTTQAKLLHIIQAHGRDNPIPWQEVRGALALQGVALGDRAIRREATALKALGYMIVNTNGYWIARDESDSDAVERAADTIEKHADSEYEDARQLREWATHLQNVKRVSVAIQNQLGLFVAA